MPSLRYKDMGPGKHACRRASPAQRGLVPDAHVQDVETTQLFLMPPVQRPIIGKAGSSATNSHGVEVAHIPVGEQILDGAVNAERKR
jgi:hypothetical protein